MMLTRTNIYGKMYLMGNNFGYWLQQQREEQKLTQADLAKASQLNRSMISKIENGGAFPTPETLNHLSKGLRIAPEVIFRAAGLLPTLVTGDFEIEQLTYLYNELPFQEKKRLVEYALFLVFNAEKENQKK